MYTEYLGPIEGEHLSPSNSLLEHAARFLQRGELVAFPTETVYGLGANILNENALKNLFVVKKRAGNLRLPVQLATLDQVRFVAREVPKAFDLLAQRFLPGPLTIILKKSHQLSPLISAGGDTVAIRLPSNAIARRLVELTGCPLATPSANLSGQLSPTKSSHVFEDFNGVVRAVVDGGETKHGFESTVISLENPEDPVILRLGVIPEQDIAKVLGRPVRVDAPSFFSKSPLHSRPIVRLFSSPEEIHIYLQLSSRGKRLIMSREEEEVAKREKCGYFELSVPNLYDGLRLAKRERCGEILVLCNAQLKANRVLMNRLKQIAIS